MVSAEAAPSGGAPTVVGAFTPSSERPIDIERVEGRIRGSLLTKVRRLIEDHPDEAVEVIRGWMAEDYVH